MGQALIGAPRFFRVRFLVIKHEERRRPVTLLIGLGALLTASVLGAIATRQMAMHFGAASFGALTLALSFAVTVQTLTEFGQIQVLQRELVQSEHDEPRLLSMAIALRLIIMLGAVPTAFLVGWLLFRHTNHAYAVIAVMIVSIPLSSLSQVFFSYYLNHFWNRRLALYQIAQQVLVLTGISILIDYHRPLIECAGVIVCSSIIILASMALEVHRKVHLRPSINKFYAFWFLREAAPVGLSTLLLAMYQRADVLLLGVEGTSIQVGHYGIVMAISSFFVMVPTTLTRNFMPLISRPDRDHWLATLRDLQSYSWALGFGSVVVIESTAPYVVHLFAGSEYVAAVTPLRILCVGLLASFIIPILTLLSLARGTQRSMVRPTLLMLIVNVVLNALVIPRYGIAGCAWATVASEFTGLAVMTRVVQRELRLRPSHYLRPLPAAAATTTALAAVWPFWHFHPASFLQLIISLVVVAVVFGSVLAMCGGFPRSIQKIVLPGRRSRPGKWMRFVIRDPWTR